MANYKTLKEILDQDSWSGLDVGKAYLINYINSKTDKPLLDNETFNTMLSGLSNRQNEIFTAYKQLATNLSLLQDTERALKQQFYNSFNIIQRNLEAIKREEQAFKNYISSPLIVNKELYNTLKKSQEDKLKKQTYTGWSFLLVYINTLLEVYLEENKNDLEPELKAIFSKYEKEPVLYTATQYAPESEQYKNYLQALYNSFSKIYGINNTAKDIVKYIEAETIGAVESLDIVSTKKISDKYTVDLINKYDHLKRAESNYTGCKYTSVYTQEVNSLLEAPIEISKLIALKLKLNEANSTDKAELPQIRAEILNNYSDLFSYTKKELGKKLDIFNKPDNELLDKLITFKELSKSNILAIEYNCDENTELKLIRENLLEAPVNSLNEYVIREKARAGICIALSIPNNETKNKEKDQYLRFTDNFSFIPKSVNLEHCRIYQTQGIGQALNYVYSFNSLLDVYSDLFKVNLLPLKDNEPFNLFANEYNTSLFMFYDDLTGDPKTLQNKQSILKGTFQPIVLESWLPDQQKVKEYTELLKDLCKTDLLKVSSGEYINPFMNNLFKEGLK